MHSTIPILADKKLCTGCMACVDVCPVQAIMKSLNPDGHYYVTVSEKKCIGCKKCENICNTIQKGNGDANFELSQVFAGWAQNDKLRKNATSGGVFAAMAAQFIRNGGKVVGACFDGKKCSYKIIDKVDDIEILQGSKYMYCDPEGIFKQIENVLAVSPVLFAGIGCHVAAIISFFEKSKYKERLFTIDIICGGVPSLHLVNSYFMHNPDIQRIVSFRTKERYELKVETNNKVVTRNAKDLPLGGFSCELTNRYSCYDCSFCNPHRKCDITIGDLWNRELFTEERENGISSVVVHSEKGRQLLDSSEIMIYAIKWTEVLYTNSRLIYGKRRIRFPRRILACAFKHLPYRTLEKMYATKIEKYDILWMVYRILRVIANRVDRKKIVKYIDHMVKKHGL